MSTKPGVTSRPSASIDALRGLAARVDVGDDAVVDRDVGRARLGAGSVDDGAAPDDQIVRHDDASSRSCGSSSWASSWCDVRAVVPVGAEARAGDDEAFDTEVRPARAAVRRTTSGGPTTAKRSTNSGVQRLGVRRVVPQVHVAVVAAADVGDDRAIGLGQARAGRARHRGEVRERGDPAADQAARDVEVGMAADVDVRAERDLVGIATGVDGRLARDVERPRDAVRIGADRERHALRDATRRGRAGAGPTRRCRAAPWACRARSSHWMRLGWPSQSMVPPPR